MKVIALGLLLLLIIGCADTVEESGDWSHYLGDAESNQYSSLAQINTDNVHQLKEVWTHDNGHADPNDRSQIQCNPLVIDGVLYGSSASMTLFALDASNGTKLWEFDAFDGKYEMFGMGVNRGLAWHEDDTGARLFFSAGSKLFAINPQNGIPIEGFGDAGAVDYHEGLDADVEGLFIVSNTPRVSESTGAAPGHIRAYDVRSGEQKWIFHTIPHPGEYGYDTWPPDAYRNSGGANTWAGFSLDQDRGLLFAPTGSAAFDFYGGDRHGDNLFANSIVALNASTGERKWHYQTIHHDMWDKDLPAPPNLVTIKKEGEDIDALVQITKNGILFVLDRVTGEPIYPIEEIEVKPSLLKGEKSSPTQPWPTVYPAFSRTHLTDKDIATRDSEAARYAKAIFEGTDHDGPFDPPSERGSIIFPGLDGGGEWGGAAIDKTSNSLIVNSNEMPWRMQMDRVVPLTVGQGTYKSFCQNCHGDRFQGNELFGNVPSLINLKERKTLKEVSHIVRNGKGVMPGVSWLPDDRIEALYNYINGDEQGAEEVVDENWPYPYRIRGYEKLYAGDGYPIITPPWGQLTSIDLDRAKINWQIPLGEHADLSAKGMPITGTENYGGPAVTAGGVIFIAATMDEKIRAFDVKSGEELWKADLPAAGYATPAVYSIDDKQYVVIACGGGKLKTKSGDSYVAFSL